MPYICSFYFVIWLNHKENRHPERNSPEDVPRAYRTQGVFKWQSLGFARVLLYFLYKKSRFYLHATKYPSTQQAVELAADKIFPVSLIPDSTVDFTLAALDTGFVVLLAKL